MIELLETYCADTALLRELNKQLQDLKVGDPAYTRTLRLVLRVTGAVVQLASKLRLTPAAHIDRRSRIQDERGEDPDRLLGGMAVWEDEDSLH